MVVAGGWGLEKMRKNKDQIIKMLVLSALAFVPLYSSTVRADVTIYMCTADNGKVVFQDKFCSLSDKEKQINLVSSNTKAEGLRQAEIVALDRLYIRQSSSNEIDRNAYVLLKLFHI